MLDHEVRRRWIRVEASQEYDQSLMYDVEAWVSEGFRDYSGLAGAHDIGSREYLDQPAHSKQNPYSAAL